MTQIFFVYAISQEAFYIYIYIFISSNRAKFSIEKWKQMREWIRKERIFLKGKNKDVNEDNANVEN